MVLAALLEHGRQTLDEIRATLERAVFHNDLGGVAPALAMLDHVNGDPECQEAESSAPAQAAV